MLTWELPCPQCGGPNRIAADRHCLTCAFCGAGLWVRLSVPFPTMVAPHRVKRRRAVFAWDRFLKDHDQPLSHSGSRRATLVYLPFWRIAAVIAAHVSTTRTPVSSRERYGGEFSSRGFTAVDDRREESTAEWVIKPWQLTVPAFAEGDWGLDTLGVRAGTVPMVGWDRLVQPRSVQAVCWPGSVGVREAFDRFKLVVPSILGSSHAVDKNGFHLIAPRNALVYWPVWSLTDTAAGRERGVEIDAVTGHVIREVTTPLAMPDTPEPGRGAAPALLPHRCRPCGHDLPVDDQSVVFRCANCGTLTAHDGRGRRHVIGALFAEPPKDRRCQWYPFWAFEPGPILVPAFAIRNYQRLVRFGTIISSPGHSLSPVTESRRPLVGVSLSPDVAAGLATVIRRQRKEPHGNASDDAADITPPQLVYLPLMQNSRELVDPVTGLCLSRSALATA